ncbi:MAG: hypothetical protein FJ087_00225 [Deltaproteobacteria bacterium]|nr:hypothetical protein [Deltaproteobacteria bacterium]
MHPNEVRGTWKLVLGMLLTVVVMVFALVKGAGAQTARGDGPGTGVLSAVLAGGRQVEMPLAHTDVDIAVSGLMARANRSRSGTCST